MEQQEEFFKERAAAPPLGQGIKTPFVCVIMSTTDRRWLDRDLDINYCWDNIRRLVLFRTAINKIISDKGPDSVRFVGIAPHTLIHRLNPKVFAQNTGEHHQLWRGLGIFSTLVSKTWTLTSCALPLMALPSL